MTELTQFTLANIQLGIIVSIAVLPLCQQAHCPLSHPFTFGWAVCGGRWYLGWVRAAQMVHIPPQVSSTTDGLVDGESFLWKRVSTVLGYGRGCLKRYMTSWLTQPVLVPPWRGLIAELWVSRQNREEFLWSPFCKSAVSFSQTNVFISTLTRINTALFHLGYTARLELKGKKTF